jgi:hypothetical protein
MKKSHSVRPLLLAASLLLHISPFCFHARGVPGDVDLSFDPGSGVNGPVQAVAVQPDGKILNSVVRPYVARLYGDSPWPSLSIARSNAFVIVSWLSPAIGFGLQQNTNLNTTHWTTSPETVTDNGTTRSITVSPAAGSRFYRLFKP